MNLFRAIFSNSSGILFSRITGMIRDMMTASILGVNIYSDIFFVAFQLPNLFRRIFGEGAFTQTFIPAFTRVKQKILFSGAIFNKLLIAVSILTILVFIFDSEVTKLIASGFSDQTVEEAKIFVVINFLYLPLIFIVTYFSSVLHYREHFATTAYSTALLNISLIISLVLSKGNTEREIVFALSYGVVAGGIAQIIAHLIALKLTNMNKFAIGGIFKWHRFDEVKHENKSFFNKFFLSMWGGSTTQISSFLDTVIASFLSTGAISYLYFANRLFQFPLAIFALAVSMAIFPRISKYIKSHRQEMAIEMLKKGFWILLYLLTISTIIGVIFAEKIIELLFERGNFNSSDKLETAQVLIYYLLGLTIYGIAKLFSLWLYAHEKAIETAKISTYSLIIKIIFSFLFLSSIGGSMGASGLALSTTLSSLALLIFTINEFGWDKFYKIIKNIELIRFIIILFILISLLLEFK